jgi:hypothetical protein
MIQAFPAVDFPDHPAQTGPQFTHAALRAAHLPGMRVTPGHHHQPPAHPLVALLDAHSRLAGLLYQAFPRPVVEPCIRRIANIFGLHRSVHVHVLDLCRTDHAHCYAGIDRRFQHSFRTGFAEPLSPPRHTRWINGKLVLKILPAAEVLPVEIFHPAGHNCLAAQVMRKRPIGDLIGS